MPLGRGVRYRVTRRGGKKIRLAFRGNKVLEATPLMSRGSSQTATAKKRRKKRKRY